MRYGLAAAVLVIALAALRPAAAPSMERASVARRADPVVAPVVEAAEPEPPAPAPPVAPVVADPPSDTDALAAWILARPDEALTPEIDRHVARVVAELARREQAGEERAVARFLDPLNERIQRRNR
jgi:hypothetical protein